MKNTVILLCIFSMLAIWAVMHQPAGIMTDYEIKFWDSKEPQADIINERFGLDREPALLYLDPGDAPYFFRANSSCRYVAPLPIQRDAPGWDLTGLPQYWEEYDCIMNYTGRYIVFDAGNHYDGLTDWFSEGFKDRQPIMQKIHSEYQLVYNGSWRIYQRVPVNETSLLPLMFNISYGDVNYHYVRLSFNSDRMILNVNGAADKGFENVPGVADLAFSGNTSLESIDVPMIPAIRYAIDVSNESFGYYHRYWIYPRENEYVFKIP